MEVDRRTFLKNAAYGVTSVGLHGVAEGNADPYYSKDSRITDYSGYLDKSFPHVKRKETRFVVVHCTATDHYFDFLNTIFSLRTLLSPTRNTHYLISRNGNIGRLVPDDLVAYHAGISMWDGHENLNLSSIGVEFEGSNERSFTDGQYDAFRFLYRDGPNNVKGRYGISDKDVLFHSWVAYCSSKKMHRELGMSGNHARAHRGRKSDPGVLFDRRKAGILDSPDCDPDVRSGRLISSPYTRIFLYPASGQAVLVQNGKELSRYDVETKGQIQHGSFTLSKKTRNVNRSVIEISSSNKKFIIEVNDVEGIYDNLLIGTPVDVK